MKTPRLPQTDFANYAMMNVRERARALTNHSTYVPPFTLQPFRQALPEICNVQQGMFKFEHSPLDIVIRHVRQKCRKHPLSEQMCVEVSEAVWQHVTKAQIYCEERVVERVPMGGGWSVNYWHDFYMVQEGQLISPFFDGRKGSTRLSREGALFVCSLVEHFLARGRFKSMKARVYQFPERRGKRQLEIVEFKKSELLKISELEQRVRETAILWSEILKKAA